MIWFNVTSSLYIQLKILYLMFKHRFFSYEWYFYTQKEKNIKQNFELFLPLLLIF